MKFSTSLVKFGSVGDLALEMKKALTAIAAGWNVEHHPDGTHGAITAEPGGNVALTDAPNTFTETNTHTAAIYLQAPAPTLGFIETDQPANLQRWHLTSFNQSFSIVTNDDTWGSSFLAVAVNRAGGISERGRTMPLGEWIDIPFNATYFTTPTGGATWTVTAATYAYMLVGKTVYASLAILATATVTGAPVRFSVTLPVTPNRTMGGPFIYTVGATTGTGLWSTTPGVGTLDLLRDVLGTTFPAGSMYLFVPFTYSIA